MNSRMQRSGYADLLRDLEVVTDIIAMIELINIMMDLCDFDRSRMWHVRPINLERPQQGHGDNLITHMLYEDDELFFNYTRMTTEQFENLLNLISPMLQRENTRPDIISPRTMLAVTLRYLATGDSLKSCHFNYRIGYSTMPNIIYDTCDAICEVLLNTYLPPFSAQRLTNISNGFRKRTSFPHIIGAIDGKHIFIRSPPNSGSQYFCYKKRYSIAFVGICDADYKFTYVNIGGYGSESDGGIFKDSNIQKLFENNRIPLPQPERVFESDRLFPYWLVGDAAFPLRRYLMTPYGGRGLDNAQLLFNKELSRGRILIENAFGILTARWQIFLNTINILPHNVDKIIMTCVLLHNLLCSANQATYITDEFVDRLDSAGNVIPGSWRTIADNFRRLPPRFGAGARNATIDAITMRNDLKDCLFQYF